MTEPSGKSRKVEALYRRLLAAWNARDAAKMAACFSERATMIGFDGSLATGAEAIRTHLEPIFADHPTARFVSAVRGIRFVGDTAILVADAGMVPPGGEGIEPNATARQSLVARVSGAEWLIELFQNTPTALHWDSAGRDAINRELDALARAGGFANATEAKE